MITNPYNSEKEPISYNWFEEIKRPQLEAAQQNKKKQVKITIILDQPLYDESEAIIREILADRKTFGYYPHFNQSCVTVEQIES